MKVDAFFQELGILAVTFDDIDSEKFDVLVLPHYSEVIPADVSTKTFFSKNTPLHIPLVGAGMEFMEHRLAIALAMEGGIGIIHRNLSIERQSSEIGKVKHYLHGGSIPNPKTVKPDETLEEVINRMRTNGWRYHSLPVVDAENKFVGLLTHNTFKFSMNAHALVRDVMVKNVLTVNVDVANEEAFHLMLEHEKGALPVVNEEGYLKGLFVFEDLKRLYDGTSVSNVDTSGQLRVGGAVGVGDAERERCQELCRNKCDVLVLDTAHADSRGVHEMLEWIKNALCIDVVAGNIATEAAAKGLAERGVDGVKIGIGGGSICTTRVVTGIGIPQLTAVWQCAKALRGYDIPVCADGGIRFSGDIAKAIVAGAHSVMMGGALAGTEEAAGEVFSLDGQLWKTNRGMGSLDAMRESKGSRERYNRRDDDEIVPQGIEGRVPFVGPAKKIIHQFVGGVRAAMGYNGAGTVGELQEKADFVLQTSAGRKESHPHDVVITKEAPNYSQED